MSANSQRAVHVVGVGMIPFTKPGASEPYNTMGARAAKLALEDAGVPYEAVQQAYVGYVYGDSTAGQAAIYGVGLTGIPVFNLNNNCSTGSSALFLARQAVASGMVECAIALGFEQMVPGALKGAYDDRPSPMTRFAEVMTAHQGFDPAAPRAAQFFGGARRGHGLAHRVWSAHPLPVLPAHLRRGSGHRLLCGLCQEAQVGRQRGDCRTGHDHRHAQHL
jgi:acetyl-CoA acetyltransferase